MKQNWSNEELAEHWSLTQEQLSWVSNRTGHSRLGFSVLLKFFEFEGRFPNSRREIPLVAIDYLAVQLGLERNVFANYELANRSAKRDRSHIRKFLGFSQATVRHGIELATWLKMEILPVEDRIDHLRDSANTWYRRNRIEPPTAARLDRIVASATNSFQATFFATLLEKIPLRCRIVMDKLIEAPDNESHLSDVDRTPMAELRADPGRPSLESALRELPKLQHIVAIGLPENLFEGVPPLILKKYRLRAATEKPRELRRHTEPIRFTLLSAFFFQRQKEIIDGLIDLLIQIVHRIGVRSERKVIQALLSDLRKVHGKTTLLFRIAEAVVDTPDGVVKDVIYPVAGEQTLRDLVREHKSTGTAYKREVHTIMRSSYSSHYRRMLQPLLDALVFRSNNAIHRPLIEALEFLKTHRDDKRRLFALNQGVPIEGVVRNKLLEFVVEKDANGAERVNRINYEIAVLQSMRDRLRCKEIWVSGADRYRNPDDDLPSNFESNREEHYAALNQSIEPNVFVSDLKQSMAESLEGLNTTLPRNSKVTITQQKKARIVLSPIQSQPEPVNISGLKAEIARRWPMTSLLDVLKEADLRTGFTDEFHSASSREVIGRSELQRRLLFCFYGLGTNTGLKRVSGSDIGITYDELLHIRRRFIHKDSLRSAIAKVVNAIFRVRRQEIWGEGTTVCASDSKKFGAWDQNLMTEWHVRYGGRGVMIYWHVERKSACIYSQLKRCSSSEVAAMIEGVMRHCTEMSVEKNYVDSHGQSEVAFAFCHLIGFELLPRLKGISRKKLYRVEPGNPDEYPNLQPILTRPIKWELIANQYDEIVKYATALRLGTADSEAILRKRR